MIFIPGSVPSSKNSRQFNYKAKKSFPSKAVSRWRKESAEAWSSNREAWLSLIKEKPKPYKVNFFLIRGSRHRFDYLNPAQTLQDAMVHHGWLEDDNCEIMIPYFSSYAYSKDNPGVWISLL